MATVYATASDVAARWRPLTSAENAIADLLCSDASYLIRARFPGIDGQVGAGTMDAAILTMVVAGMVKRALIAPDDGVTQESQSVGPISESRSFANPMRNVFLTAADLVLIQGYQPSGMSGTYANTTVQSVSSFPTDPSPEVVAVEGGWV